MAVLFILAVLATASAVNVPTDFRNENLQLKVLALTGMVERMQSQFDDLQEQHQHLEIKLAGWSKGRRNIRHQQDTLEPSTVGDHPYRQSPAQEILKPPIVGDHPERQSSSPDGYADVKTTNKRSSYTPTFSLTNYWNRTTNGQIGIKGNTSLTGPKGEPGVHGFQGVRGIDGEKGAKGDLGLKGDNGPNGITGPKGDTGRSGTTGPKGDTGRPGSMGTTGVTGQKGENGVAGVVGQPGLKGDKGSQGLRGHTGYGQKGAPGRFVVGRTGAKGDTGIPGAKGEPGRIGFTGATGSHGTNTKVAFTVDYPIPTFITGDAIVFREQQLNIGNYYDPVRGTFQCGVSGVYVFTWSMVVSTGHIVTTGLNVNGTPRGHVICNEFTGSNTVVVSLNVQDIVSVVVTSHDNANGALFMASSAFSGFLLN